MHTCLLHGMWQYFCLLNSMRKLWVYRTIIPTHGTARSGFAPSDVSLDELPFDAVSSLNSLVSDSPVRAFTMSFWKTVHES